MKNISAISRWVMAVTAITLISAGCSFAANQNTDSPENPANQNAAVAPARYFTYQGEDGKTALEILKTKYQVQTKEFPGAGEFVESINGTQPTDQEFWAFYVNGQTSNVGASSYATKSSDKIEWKIEKITQ